MADIYDELEFPQRAEYLDHYDNYEVDISHWAELSAQFRKAFRQVYARRSAAVVLVHGAQGSGKSLFCRRLAQDYQRTSEGAFTPDMRDNLWHALVAGSPPEEHTIREVTRDALVRLVNERDPGWLEALRSFAVEDRTRVRVFLCNDAHKDTMMRPWTRLGATEFFTARQGGPDAVRAHVAERINEACRHEFARSLFVMLSNDEEWVNAMMGHLDRWYRELTTRLTLPVPEATCWS